MEIKILIFFYLFVFPATGQKKVSKNLLEEANNKEEDIQTEIFHPTSDPLQKDTIITSTVESSDAVLNKRHRRSYVEAYPRYLVKL